MRGEAAAQPVHELVLCIGGLVGRFELWGANRTFVEQVMARYAAFELPALPAAECDFSLRLDLCSAPPPGVRDAIAEADAHPLTVKVTDRTIRIERWDLAARLVAEGRGRRAIYRGRARCEMSPFSVDCILRVLWATLLPRVGGMLVHSCGLRYREVSVVFPGASGAGKTTIARKTPDPDRVLSDEICIIRRGDDGWRVHGTPFWGDFARGGVSMRSWPLRTLAFLARAPRDTVTVTPMVSSQATFRLLGCFLSYAGDRSTIARNVALTVRLTSEVRSVEARLTKAVPTAAIFRKLAPHLGPDVSQKAPAPNAREMISDFRWFLRKHGTYAFRAEARAGGFRSDTTIKVKGAAESDLVPGDVALYWRPGRSPEDDTLVCLPVGRKARPPVGEKRTEVLGKIDLGMAVGRAPRPPARISDLTQVSGSLLAALAPQMTRTT